MEKDEPSTSSTNNSSSTSPGGNDSQPGMNVFECTICLESAKEPVVTKCGHIFCWPCIYSWLESKGSSAKCPNCKNPISKDNLIPIYTKDENKDNTKKFNIPKRPKGERTPNSESDNGGSSGFSSSFSFGFFPFFGYGINFGNTGGFFGGFNNNNNNNNTNNGNGQSFQNLFDNLPPHIKSGLKNILILFGMMYFYYMFTHSHMTVYTF